LSRSPADRSRLLLRKIELAARAGVQWIQIREKDLSGSELASLARQALLLAPPPCRILINDRLDVAWAVEAAGVHLTEESVPVAEARKFLRTRGLPSFLVGASTHSLPSARAAADSGADYLVFGPVFATPSKVRYGTPQGIERLAELCHSVSVPVLAIGGVTPENAAACAAAGAAGVAAIRMFQHTKDLATIVRQLRQV
jgi:thiamine-phosphate pyrophosphorylase